MKNQIIIFAITLLTLCGGIPNANAQGFFIEKSKWLYSSDSVLALDLNDDNTFALFAQLNLYPGVWKKIDENIILLHFDKNKKRIYNKSHPRMKFKGDHEVKILNNKELKFNEYVLTKIPWSSKPAKLTLRDSVFTFNINDLSYTGTWQQKNDRVSILHLDKDSEIFFPIPGEAIMNILNQKYYNFKENRDEYMQTKIPWVVENKDMRFELSNDGIFSLLYRRKFYTGQWNKNAENQIQLQFDEQPEFETLWNMGYFEIDKSDPNFLGEFTSESTEHWPSKRLQINNDQTFILLDNTNIQTGLWKKENDNIIRLHFNRINKKQAKNEADFDSYFDVKIINSDELKYYRYILKKQ